MAIKKTPAKPADLNADYDTLARENRRLTELNQDLNSQLKTMRESRTISPEELESIRLLREDFNRLNGEQIELAKWLGRNKSKEIDQGKHKGMTLADVCIMYMAKGLD